MGRLISEKYAAWQAECEERFQQLKKNEEELNRIFIDIYGLQDELTPDVADKDVTVHRVFDSKDDVPESMKGSNYVRTMRDEIVSLISYAVGCMFGRYSLDVEGLAYAGGEWDASKYKTIVPDSDNIIPICDDEYFDDDITGSLSARSMAMIHWKKTSSLLPMRLAARVRPARRSGTIFSRSFIRITARLIRSARSTGSLTAARRTASRRCAICTATSAIFSPVCVPTMCMNSRSVTAPSLPSSVTPLTTPAHPSA